MRRSLHIAGAEVLLRFPNPGLAEAFLPALAHLVVASGAPPALTVCVWDTRSTGVSVPPPPWQPEEYLARGDIQGWSGDVHAAYNLGAGTLSLFDPARAAAMYWVADAGSLPLWERAAPLRTILGWFLRTRRCEFLHAGAVGNAAGGVLLAGRGGRGKSTVALSSVAGDGPLRYAGDDYVAVELDPTPRVHSVYSSGKLHPAHAAALLPELAPLVLRRDDDREEKGLLFVHQHLPQRIATGFPLRAVLLPTIGAPWAAGGTLLRRVSPLSVLQEIVPTTLNQMPGADQRTFGFLASLVRAVPCYELASGPDLARTRDAITALLAETA